MGLGPIFECHNAFQWDLAAALPVTLLLDAQCGYIALELVHTVVATTEFSFFDVIMKWDLYLIAGSLEAAYSLN